MGKFLVVALAVSAASACTTIRNPDGTTQRYLMLQSGVIVRVLNNCAPFLDLERATGIVVKALPYGGSVTVPLVSTPLSGSSRRMPLTAKGYTADMEYLGSITREFYVSSSEGSHEEFWEVNRINLPGRRGGCQ